jgi:hypothetical protein
MCFLFFSFLLKHIPFANTVLMFSTVRNTTIIFQRRSSKMKCHTRKLKKKNPNFFSSEFPTDQHENFCHICMCSVPFSTEYFQSFHMGRRYLKSGPPCKTLRDLATNFYHLLGFARNLASES